MTQKTTAIILLILILFSFSVRPAEANCKWYHPHHCLAKLVKDVPLLNKVGNAISNVIDNAVQVVTTPFEAVVDLVKDGKTDAFKKLGKSYLKLGKSIWDLGAGIVNTAINAVVIILRGIESLIYQADCIVGISKIWKGNPKDSCAKLDELWDKIKCRGAVLDKKVSEDCPIDCSAAVFDKWQD